MEARGPATIPSYTHVTELDPNAQRNRIPTEAELAGLKAFKETHSSLVTQLQGEVNRAQAAHERILGRYHQQLCELEGTQSQLHESKRTLQVLQDQVLVHQAEVARLSGITHPIRRYPSDVLQYLFEYTHDVTEEDLKLSAAFALSHVCRRWRAIALDTPRLWCRIDFMLEEGEGEEVKVRLFWDSMISRMKSAPAVITIHGHNRATSVTFSECNLALIPNILKLSLHPHSPEAVSAILSLPNPFPETGMGSLSITYVPEAGPELASRVVWDIGEIMDKLPFTPYLSLWAPCSLRVTPSANFGTLTKLRLTGLINVDVIAILSSCTQLSELVLLQVAFSSVTSDRTISHSLRRLIVTTNDEDWWIKQILCPNLLAFYHETGSSESTLSFVESHRSILTLAHSSGEELVPKLAIIAPHLQSLETDGSQLRALCTPQATGAEFLPFPCLRELTVDLDSSNTTLDEFEVLVGTRCLPIGHPQSQLPPSLAPLRRLYLQQDPKKASNEHDEPWRQSALYKEAKRVIVSDDIWGYYRIEKLSWT